MADQIEELIREIAAKHGIAVARDDPILVLQTINNRLLLESATTQRNQLEHFKEELEAVSMRWRTDAKEKADRALSASKEAMRATPCRAPTPQLKECGRKLMKQSSNWTSQRVLQAELRSAISRPHASRCSP